MGIRYFTIPCVFDAFGEDVSRFDKVRSIFYRKLAARSLIIQGLSGVPLTDPSQMGVFEIIRVFESVSEDPVQSRMPE